MRHIVQIFDGYPMSETDLGFLRDDFKDILKMMHIGSDCEVKNNGECVEISFAGELNPYSRSSIVEMLGHAPAFLGSSHPHILLNEGAAP